MYSRFRLDGDRGVAGAEVNAHRLDIIDDIENSNELVINTDRQIYRFMQSGNGGQFSCQDRATLELDMIGFCGSRTLLQSVVLSTVAEMTQECFIFHAGVVARGNDAIIFPASSGRGKTTLVFRLVKNGCAFLSDEAACINPDDKTVAPFPRKLIVRRDSEGLLGAPIPQNAAQLPPEAHEWESAFDIEDVVPGGIAGEPCTPRHIVFLDGFGDEPRLEYLANSNALFELFRYAVKRYEDMSSLLFRFGELLDGVKCYTLVAGDPDKTAAMVMDLFE